MEILRSKGSGSTAVVQYMDLGMVLVRFSIVRNKIIMLNTSKICIMCLYMTAYVANVYKVYVYCDFPFSNYVRNTFVGTQCSREVFNSVPVSGSKRFRPLANRN